MSAREVRVTIEVVDLNLFNSDARETGSCWCWIDVCDDDETHQSIVERCRTANDGPPEIHEEHTCKKDKDMVTSSCQIQGDEGIQVERVKRRDLRTQIWLLVECKTTWETLKEWHFAKENSRFDSWWSCSRTSGFLHFVTNRGPCVLNERLRLIHADKTKDTHQSRTSNQPLQQYFSFSKTFPHLIRFYLTVFWFNRLSYSFPRITRTMMDKKCVS